MEKNIVYKKPIAIEISDSQHAMRAKMMSTLFEKGYLPVRLEDRDQHRLTLVGDVRKNFPKLHPLLKHFDIQYIQNTNTRVYDSRTVISVSENAPVEYFSSYQWVADLTKYVEAELVMYEE